MFTRRNPRRLTASASVRRRIQQLGPYQSLGLMILPIAVVEPLKIVALFVAGNGHWLSGTGILIAAYLVSLFVVERLFKVVQSKLMTLNWFATLWIWFTTLRDTSWRWLRAFKAKRSKAIGTRQP